MEALIDAYAVELKLPTVRRRFRALAADATRAQQTPVVSVASRRAAFATYLDCALLGAGDAADGDDCGLVPERNACTLLVFIDRDDESA